jgi:hypothetical protein
LNAALKPAKVFGRLKAAITLQKVSTLNDDAYHEGFELAHARASMPSSSGLKRGACTVSAGFFASAFSVSHA